MGLWHDPGVRAFALAVPLVLAGCPTSSADKLRVGIDTGLEEMGLGAWLEAAFEGAGGVRPEVRYLPPQQLEAEVRAGRLDEVLGASTETRRALEKEGLFVAAADVAHEELLLIGPFEDHLGKYADTRGAELLRNVARTNHRYLEPAPDTLEGVRHRQLFLATGDIAKPGAWFSTGLSGVELVKAAVDGNSFALVRRSSVLFAAREGVRPHRIWSEQDPALVVQIWAAVAHPELSGRPRRPGFFDWLNSEVGREAVATFGKDRLGHPLLAEGAPPPGQGASTGPLGAFFRAAR